MSRVVSIHKYTLTKGEVHEISVRVDEITRIMDLCGPNDDDVIENLERELDQLEAMLTRSIKYAKHAGGGR